MSDQTTCNRLGVIESDIKSILTAVSSLKSTQDIYLKELEELKKSNKYVISCQDKYRGGLYVVYLLLTIFGAAIFQLSVGKSQAHPQAFIESRK